MMFYKLEDVLVFHLISTLGLIRTIKVGSIWLQLSYTFLFIDLSCELQRVDKKSKIEWMSSGDIGGHSTHYFVSHNSLLQFISWFWREFFQFLDTPKLWCRFLKCNVVFFSQGSSWQRILWRNSRLRKLWVACDSISFSVNRQFATMGA